ncbi:MAG: formate dehydrogenase accessory protein FdhE [Thermoanaerobaculia bacterium]
MVPGDHRRRDAQVLKSVVPEFEKRASRAEALARGAEAARDPLMFVAALCRAQAEAARRMEAQQFTGVFVDDATRALQAMRPILHAIANHAPESLADQARSRGGEGEDVAVTRLSVFWREDLSSAEDYLSRAMLQPYAEVLRARNIAPDRVHQRGRCPFCGGAAMISARRSIPDAEAGLRVLVCALCANEWNFNRVICPACFEEHPERLPVYSSDAHPNVRIEACETCHRYVKSIDLTKDARPIPAIDDLVSIAMDLWAIEEGLTRIEPGMAGI